MGKGGTDVAKQASDMVLADDHFATIEKAIEEGRSIYRNIKKTVLFLLSSNFGEIITMFTAVLFGIASPLKASHILSINRSPIRFRLWRLEWTITIKNS